MLLFKYIMVVLKFFVRSKEDQEVLIWIKIIEVNHTFYGQSTDGVGELVTAVKTGEDIDYQNYLY